MWATASPPLLGRFGSFPQGEEAKFGEQMPWQHSTAALPSHRIQAAFTAGLGCLYFSDNS